MRSPFAYELDLEIERAFRIRRQKQRLGKRRKAQEESPKMNAGAGGQRRTLPDFITLIILCISSSIARPTMEVNHFELRPTLISMVQQSQFGGSPMEYPNLHLSIFLDINLHTCIYLHTCMRVYVCM